MSANKDMAPKFRWSKFWWKDWLGDKALRCCSPAARGLWMDLLCLAAEGAPYGHLTMNGKAIPLAGLSSNTGIPETMLKKLLAELREFGVFSETDAGVIYSRRMVKDNAASEAGRESGKNGGNPTLKTKKNDTDNGGSSGTDNGSGYEGGLTPPVGEGDKLEAKKLEAKKPEERKKVSSSLRSPRERGSEADFEAFWKAYPRKVGKGSARKAWQRAITLSRPDTIISAVIRQKFNSRERFIPHPATWLNAERWFDDVDTGDPVLRAAGLNDDGELIDMKQDFSDWLQLPRGCA